MTIVRTAGHRYKTKKNTAEICFKSNANKNQAFDINQNSRKKAISLLGRLYNKYLEMFSPYRYYLPLTSLRFLTTERMHGLAKHIVFMSLAKKTNFRLLNLSM